MEGKIMYIPEDSLIKCYDFRRCPDPDCQGNIQEGFTVLGMCLAVCCFPCGLICLNMMKEKKCENCGRKVDH